MTPAQFDQLLAVLTQIQANTDRMAFAMEQSTVNLKAPNLYKPLAGYRDFDWHTIGARVIETDDDGVTVVSWGGNLFQRRSVQNKYGPAIWYSRSLGKVDNTAQYDRLVTFREQETAIDPLPAKTRQALPAPTPRIAAVPSPALQRPAARQPLPTAAPLTALTDLQRQLNWSTARLTVYVKQQLNRDLKDLTAADVLTLSAQLLKRAAS